MTKTIIGKFGIIVLLIALGLTILIELNPIHYVFVEKSAIIILWIIGGILYIPLDEIMFDKEKATQ